MCCSNVFKVCFCSSLGSHADLFVCVVFRLLMFTLGSFLSFRWDRRQRLVTIVASQVRKNQRKKIKVPPRRNSRSPLRRKKKVAAKVAAKVATKVSPELLLVSCSTRATRQQQLTAQQLSAQQLKAQQLSAQQLSPQRVPKAKELARERERQRRWRVVRKSAGRSKLT